MKPTDNLPPDAELLLDIMIEEFRKVMAPSDDPAEFRAAALELMNAGYACIYQDGDNYSLRLTPEGKTALAGMAA